MDLGKAFDVLPHILLLTKLKAYNVSDQGCEIVKSYLSMRSHNWYS